MHILSMEYICCRHAPKGSVICTVCDSSSHLVHQAIIHHCTQTHLFTDTHSNLSYSHTCMHTHIHTDRQTDCLTDRDRDRDRDRDLMQNVLCVTATNQKEANQNSLAVAEHHRARWAHVNLSRSIVHTLVDKCAIKNFISAFVLCCVCVPSLFCCACSLRITLLGPGIFVLRRWRKTGR